LVSEYKLRRTAQPRGKLPVPIDIEKARMVALGTDDQGRPKHHHPWCQGVPGYEEYQEYRLNIGRKTKRVRAETPEDV